MTFTKTHSLGLDQQFEELSEKHDISTARLKAVYFRGVEEYMSSDMTVGSATMYGLARVQRFLKDPTLDADLSGAHEYHEDLSGLDINEESMQMMFSVLYGTGDDIARQFHPGQVTGITVLDDAIQIDGVLGDDNWSYTLNTTSGASEFGVSSTS